MPYGWDGFDIGKEDGALWGDLCRPAGWQGSPTWWWVPGRLILFRLETDDSLQAIKACFHFGDFLFHLLAVQSPSGGGWGHRKVVG